MREIVLDTETTGLDPLRGDRVVEIGCIEIYNRMADALRTERLPAALTQGLRDFFGAHTYGRIDEDPGKKFHTLWSGDRSEVPA